MMQKQDMPLNPSKYVPWLRMLAALFIFRVLAQLIQFYFDVPFLPHFQAWHSGALPYGWLIFFQVLIVGILLSTTRKFSTGTVVPSRAVGRCLISLGLLYFVGMLLRLCIGLIFTSSPSWFHVPIPTFFHLVLASFVILVGHFHFVTGDKDTTQPVSARSVLTWVVYPGVMLFTLLLYYQLIDWGINLAMSSYIAAMVGGFGLITFFELKLPYRKEWLPTRGEIKSDLLFMILIQVLLPHVLSLFTVVWIADFVQQFNWRLTQLWPQTYPLWVQMLLMMFSADFFRYWLHRAAHTWIPLWRFHAVHHSVQKLYWINVGRFHPVDKALQFICDTLPFILLGVPKEVVTLYFVVYSIKGFFQHSNVDVKLGWFNYIISGPELHRWHHSKRIKESNSNYGNNVIVWDILFGTFFLPQDQEVSELGLFNRNYPMGFFAQLKAPFVKGLDKGK